MINYQQQWILKEESPEYKLKNFDTQKLTDSEVLSLLFGNEPQHVDLARQIILQFGTLENLSRAPLHSLLQNIELTHAQKIIAAFEISRRKAIEHKIKVQFGDSHRIAEHAMAKIGNYNQEALLVYFLDNHNVVLHERIMFIGSKTCTVVDPVIIFQEAISRGASSIAIAHNHPSGSVAPSESDRNVTWDIYKYGEILNIKLLDHLVVSTDRYYSFSDTGELQTMKLKFLRLS